jgi:hypothetical protein
MLPNRFGLRRPYFLETDQERNRRINEIEKLFLQIALEHLTKQEARNLFGKLMKRFKLRNDEKNSLILKEYDATPKLPLAKIARRLHKQYPDQFKNAELGSTAKRLSRLISERRAQKTAANKAHELLKRYSTKSILGDI